MNITEHKYRGWYQGRWYYYSVHDFLFNHIIDPSGFSRWCRWTGLLDKNGKEIYEGDILLFERKKSAVEYINNGFWVKDGERNWMPAKHMCEIISNIYENPELLK